MYAFAYVPVYFKYKRTYYTHNSWMCLTLILVWHPTFIYEYIYIYICMYIYAYLYTYIYVYFFKKKKGLQCFKKQGVSKIQLDQVKHRLMYIYICKFIYQYIYVCIYMCAYIYVCIDVCIYMNAYIYMNSHIYGHT